MIIVISICWSLLVPGQANQENLLYESDELGIAIPHPCNVVKFVNKLLQVGGGYIDKCFFSLFIGNDHVSGVPKSALNNQNCTSFKLSITTRLQW
jgi:hypothetical protein